MRDRCNVGQLFAPDDFVNGEPYGDDRTLVLARIGRSVDRETPAAELSTMLVICPRCRKKQSIDIGKASCPACGLQISIHVEESL